MRTQEGFRKCKGCEKKTKREQRKAKDEVWKAKEWRARSRSRFGGRGTTKAIPRDGVDVLKFATLSWFVYVHVCVCVCAWICRVVDGRSEFRRNVERTKCSR